MVGAQSLQRDWLLLFFHELLEGSHHVGSRDGLRLPSVLHPFFDELLNELLG